MASVWVRAPGMAAAAAGVRVGGHVSVPPAPPPSSGASVDQCRLSHLSAAATLVPFLAAHLIPRTQSFRVAPWTRLAFVLGVPECHWCSSCHCRTSRPALTPASSRPPPLASFITSKLTRWPELSLSLRMTSHNSNCRMFVSRARLNSLRYHTVLKWGGWGRNRSFTSSLARLHMLKE